MIYLRLFWAFFQIGLFSFGGGYAAVPLIQSQIVETNQWMEMSQFADLITVSYTHLLHISLGMKRNFIRDWII